MSAIAKDQLQRFTPEQQETIATLEATRIKKRQELIEQARHYRGRQWFPLVVMGISLLACAFTSHHQGILPYLAGIVLWILIQFHAAGVNRRIDALIELFQTDPKKADHDL